MRSTQAASTSAPALAPESPPARNAVTAADLRAAPGRQALWSRIPATTCTPEKTPYASVGRKPQLARLLIETAISGTDQAVPAGQRDYVRAIQAAPDAAAKITIYAAAIAAIAPRMALVLGIIQQAARDEPELAALWAEIAERRAANMRLFVADLQRLKGQHLGLYGGWGSRVSPVWARNPSMRAGRYWMRLSRFLTIAASWSTSRAARLPRPFFMFAQAPSAGLRSGA